MHDNTIKNANKDEIHGVMTEQSCRTCDYFSLDNNPLGDGYCVWDTRHPIPTKADAGKDCPCWHKDYLKTGELSPATKAKMGELFQEIIGRSVSDYQGLQDVELAVEERLGHKLESRYCNSGVISSGDVFPHRDVDMKIIDTRITEYLANIDSDKKVFIVGVKND